MKTLEETLALMRQHIQSRAGVNYYMEYVYERDGELPHLSQLVLHAKLRCRSCDQLGPDLQILRETLQIPFTDELQKSDVLMPGFYSTREEAEMFGHNRPD